jgi:hypothetical protein
MLSIHIPRLLAAAVLPLAIAGCDLDKLDVAQGAVAGAAAAAVQPLGHELYRMFDTEKGSATFGELPAQF